MNDPDVLSLTVNFLVCGRVNSREMPSAWPLQVVLILRTFCHLAIVKRDAHLDMI